jgi:hypothetical protein
LEYYEYRQRLLTINADQSPQQVYSKQISETEYVKPIGLECFFVNISTQRDAYVLATPLITDKLTSYARSAFCEISRSLHLVPLTKAGNT